MNAKNASLDNFSWPVGRWSLFTLHNMPFSCTSPTIFKSQYYCLPVHCAADNAYTQLLKDVLWSALDSPIDSRPRVHSCSKMYFDARWKPLQATWSYFMSDLIWKYPQQLVRYSRQWIKCYIIQFKICVQCTVYSTVNFQI